MKLKKMMRSCFRRTARLLQASLIGTAGSELGNTSISAAVESQPDSQPISLCVPLNSSVEPLQPSPLSHCLALSSSDETTMKFLDHFAQSFLMLAPAAAIGSPVRSAMSPLLLKFPSMEGNKKRGEYVRELIDQQLMMQLLKTSPRQFCMSTKQYQHFYAAFERAHFLNINLGSEDEFGYIDGEHKFNANVDLWLTAEDQMSRRLIQSALLIPGITASCKAKLGALHKHLIRRSKKNKEVKVPVVTVIRQIVHCSGQEAQRSTQTPRQPFFKRGDSANNRARFFVVHVENADSFYDEMCNLGNGCSGGKLKRQRRYYRFLASLFTARETLAEENIVFVPLFSGIGDSWQAWDDLTGKFFPDVFSLMHQARGDDQSFTFTRQEAIARYECNLPPNQHRKHPAQAQVQGKAASSIVDGIVRACPQNQPITDAKMDTPRDTEASVFFQTQLQTSEIVSVALEKDTEWKSEEVAPNVICNVSSADTEAVKSILGTDEIRNVERDVFLQKQKESSYSELLCMESIPADFTVQSLFSRVSRFFDPTPVKKQPAPSQVDVASLLKQHSQELKTQKKPALVSPELAEVVKDTISASDVDAATATARHLVLGEKVPYTVSAEMANAVTSSISASDVDAATVTARKTVLGEKVPYTVSAEMANAVTSSISASDVDAATVTARKRVLREKVPYAVPADMAKLITSTISDGDISSVVNAFQSNVKIPAGFRSEREIDHATAAVKKWRNRMLDAGLSPDDLQAEKDAQKIVEQSRVTSTPEFVESVLTNQVALEKPAENKAEKEKSSLELNFSKDDILGALQEAASKKRE